jgi:hypothetical protein
MNLAWIEKRLFRRLDLADTRMADYLQRSTLPPSDGPQLHELEGWLSELWQTWGRFCRHVVMESCKGCVCSSGSVVATTHASDLHVSFIAAKQRRGVPPAISGTNNLMRIEPTWGHIDKLIEVIQALSPSNRGTLLSAFGTVPAIEHVRLIRNAAAHLHGQNLADVVALQPNYISIPIKHPLHALLWTDPATGRTLAQARIDDMRIAATNACR